MPGLGWIPDPLKLPGQKKDWNAIEVLGDAPPPPRASARKHVLSILHQGIWPICVAHVVFQVIRGAHSRQGVPHPALGSRLFGNYLAKATHGAQLLDEGTYLRAFFEVCNKFGFPPESVWPYLDMSVELDGKPRWAVMPPANAFRLAFDQHAPLEFRRIYETGYDRVDAVERAIAQERLVAFGTLITKKTQQDYHGEVLDPPTLHDAIAGGHALTLAEYDENKIGGPNSWGGDSGDQGWFWMTKEYIASPLSQDFWIAEQVPPFSG